MIEQTIQIDIPVLLPGIDDHNDACIERLENAIKNRKGILRAHVENNQKSAVLCLHYDPDLITIDNIHRLAQRTGTDITNRFHHEIIEIEGMDCADCAMVIQHGIGRMDGVLTANLSYPMKKLRVEYDARKTNRVAIEKRIHAFGYNTPASPLSGWYQKNRELLFSLLSGLLLLIGWMGEVTFAFSRSQALIVILPAYIIGGWDIAQHAWGSLKERHFDTDLLMLLAALGAAALGEFVEGGLLIFLFSFGHALEERALDKARNAVRALQDLTPLTAVIRRDGLEREVPIDDLLVGDTVVICPGVRIPADGEVIAGRSAVNQAPVTGESIPSEKTLGDSVFAGTVNGEGSLEVRVTRQVSDSTLARIMKMVEEAQTQRSPTQRTVERFTAVFVPAVLLFTLVVITVPPLFGVPFKESFLRAMTLLVAASPCALALGTPSAILAGVAQAARNGILVKGGVHLENLGRLKAVALDKTGTLTYGEPEVTDIVPMNGIPSDELLILAARVECRSAHPLAAAIARRAQSFALSCDGITDVEALTGLGIRARVDGQTVWIGNEKMMLKAAVQVKEADRQVINTLQAGGKTIMLIGRDGLLLGVLALADTVRSVAADSIARIKQLGIEEVALLSGDHYAVAKSIANQVGVTEIYADLMPEDKLTIIQQLITKHGQVAMIGDGVNDAPALANATVGIAMGGAATDVALETADVALMGDDLSGLPFAIGIGRATRSIIVQNLCISVGVIALLLIASLTGLVGIGIAIVFHEGSTLIVVLNSLRLLGYKM